MSEQHKKAARWWARELKALKSYPEEYAKRWNDSDRRELQDYAAGKVSIGHATVSLDILSSVRGASGCLAVLAGNEAGFVDIDTALLYKYWSTRMLVRAYDLDERPDKQARGVLMDSVATSWMHAEAIGALGIRRYLDELITRVAEGYGGVIGREMNSLCTLAAYFATGRDVADLERSGWAPIGVYAPVVTGKLTSSDYDALAIYHQNGVDGRGYPPFHSYPYRVVPFELLAIARRTGVALQGSHPLITTPLARLREVPEIPVTEELRGVIARASAELSLES